MTGGIACQRAGPASGMLTALSQKADS